jgi:hypothetical protein
MKKIFLLLAFSICAFFVKAQDDQTTQTPAITDQKQQDIEALKVAFLSKQLDLTPEEAQQFWPVYNQYAVELKQIFKSDSDVLDRDERVLNVRKKYKDQFVKILGADRLNRLFEAEGRFHQLLIRAMRRQQENRPLRRGGY